MNFIIFVPILKKQGFIVRLVGFLGYIVMHKLARKGYEN